MHVFSLLFDLLRWQMLPSPRDGGAEKLKLQEAIPPFSLIVNSIHGKRAGTLV